MRFSLNGKKTSLNKTPKKIVANRGSNVLKDKKSNIHCFNCHIKEYIDDLNDPYTNVAYFDIMSTFFTSEKSFGSDIIIHKFLQQSKCDEII